MREHGVSRERRGNQMCLAPRSGARVVSGRLCRTPRRVLRVGGIRPAHARGKRFYVEWAAKAGGKRSGYKWATITPKSGRFSHKVRIVIPRRGTWYVRAVAPDDGQHALTVTSAVPMKLR